MNVKTVTIVLLGLLASSQTVGATTQTTDVDQGRYDLNSQAAADVGPFANFIVGTQDGIPDPSEGYAGFSYDFANFFAFDLTGVAPDSIASASVTISGGQNVFDSGPNGVFSLYASKVDPAADESGFVSGLATDDLIGSVSVTDGGTISSSNPTLSKVTVIFNATGVADLRAAAGAKFYVGGTFTGAEPYVLLPGPGGLTFANVFNGSGNAAGAVLTLAAVPEPSTWAMMLAGLAGLAAAGRRAARRRARMAR